ncbi:MAG: hypothetical protein ACSLFI_10560 [Solirubrobacterales bacterium]
MKSREKIVARMAAGVTAIVMAGCFAAGASANGFAAVGDSVIDDSVRVSFSGGPGETNQVNFSRVAPDTVQVFDGLSNIDPVAPCVAVTTNAVNCPIDKDSPWFILADLGDGSDTLAFNPPASGLLDAGEGSIDYSFITGGPGNDVIEGTLGIDSIEGGVENDRISGLRGADILRGGSGNDEILANDSNVDTEIDCGADDDNLSRDNVDPAGVGCEDIETSAANLNRTFEQRMPDVTKGIFKPMAADEIVDVLALLFPSRLDEDPLSYTEAKKLAGREPVPFEVIRQQPNPGVGLRVALDSPQKVKLSYWDPSDEAIKKECVPSTRVRSKAQKSKGLTLDKALVGLEFREGVKGNEGEAQDLLRRFGCKFDTRLVFSRSLETSSRVIDSDFKTVIDRVEKNGRVKRVKSYKLIVKVKVAKSGNDYIMLFSDNPDAPGTQLPLSDKSRAAKRENSSFRLFLREAATGRAAVGATVELHDGDAKSTKIASGKTDSNGQVDLQFRASGPDDLKLYAFKQQKDPVSGEPVVQDATVEITSTTADKVWNSLGGRIFREQKNGGYRRTADVGGRSGAASVSNVGEILKYTLDISNAVTSLSLAKLQATSLGLSSNQEVELARVYGKMLGINPTNAAAAALLGAARLEPTLGVGTAGPICESNGTPKMEAHLMPGFKGGEVKAGGAVLAKLDCGRSLLTTPSGLALLPKGWISGTQKLIANDGASLIANDGASLIANDGASLLANDGASLLANDGASFLPVSKLMSDHGAGIVSNNSGALIANDGASYNPVGTGTSLQSFSGR